MTKVALKHQRDERERDNARTRQSNRWRLEGKKKKVNPLPAFSFERFPNNLQGLPRITRKIAAISDAVVIRNIIIPAGDVGIQVFMMRALVHTSACLISAH